LIGPVERGVFVDRLTVSADGDRADGAQEYKPLQVRLHRHVEDIVQPFDVGLEQRSGIPQLRPGVDDAVVNNVAIRHGGGDLSGVEEIAVAPLDVQSVNSFGGA
jgi:hypothetical protein